MSAGGSSGNDPPVAAAVITIFVEGNSDERAALSGTPPAPAPLEQHPLVRYYGLPIEKLALTKAHRQVEGNHRRAAWDAILHHVTPMRRGAVVRTMRDALDLWLKYRDEVAEACGLKKRQMAERRRAQKPSNRIPSIALR